MEPLSGAASVISVVSLAIQICDELKKLHGFWQSVKEAPDDIANISTELKLFMTWLTVIANNYQRQGFGQKSPNEAAATDTLKLCLVIVQDMSAGVRDLESGIVKGASARQWASVKFVFRKDKREKAMAQIERMKSLLIIVQTCYLAEVQEAGFKTLNLSLSSREPILYSTHPVALNTNAANDLLAIQTRPPSPLPSSSVELVSSNPTSSSQAARRPKHRTTQQTERAYNFGLAMLRIVSTEGESIFLEESSNERRIPARQTRYDVRIAQWLLKRGLSWQSSGTYGSWQRSFRTFQYVPGDSMIVDFCRDGDIANVQRMFEKGLASPFDRVHYEHEEGSQDWSLLHFSVFFGHSQLCKFLIECGLGRGSASGMSERPILSLTSESLMSNPAAHIDILRLMIHEGQYDPMEDSIYGGVMHNFEGPSIVYEWLLDQEKFFIDFDQKSPIGLTIASSLIHASGLDTSTCLKALIARGSHVVLDGDYSLVHDGAWSLALCADDLDFPKRIKVLWDAGVDFHAPVTGTGQTPFEWVMNSAQLRIFDAKTKYNIYSVERKSIPKPPRGWPRRVIDYDILDPSLSLWCRPRLSKALWPTWMTEEELTLDAVSGYSLLEIWQRFLDAWVEVLFEAGLDIADYGRREEQLYPEGVVVFIGGEARVVFEYGSHVNGCRIHVVEVWVFDRDHRVRQQEATIAEAPAMPCSWDSDDE
ncbi:hypothetical protein BDR22DRAFT_891172 [Usnea florida]